jgi:hypothetical protein
MKLTAAHKALLAGRPDLITKMETGPRSCCDWGSIVSMLQTALKDAPAIISALETIINAIEPLVEAAA